jgi:hypothetical protein
MIGIGPPSEGGGCAIVCARGSNPAAGRGAAGAGAGVGAAAIGAAAGGFGASGAAPTPPSIVRANDGAGLLAPCTGPPDAGGGVGVGAGGIAG